MTNMMTIDLEDWFCMSILQKHIPYSDWDKQEITIIEPILKILDLLENHGYGATFFVLGYLAQRVPDLIREINSRGFEIACHGFRHLQATKMSKEEFKTELKLAISSISNSFTGKIYGHRAPVFSITSSNINYLEIIDELGFTYDSSIVPSSVHPEYGIKNFNPEIHRIGNITEIPMNSFKFAGVSIPCSGGAYFRLYPYRFSKYIFDRINQNNIPVVFYIHPWEFNPAKKIKDIKFIDFLRYRHNPGKVLMKFERLLDDFEFTSIINYLENNKKYEN